MTKKKAMIVGSVSAAVIMAVLFLVFKRASDTKINDRFEIKPVAEVIAAVPSSAGKTYQNLVRQKRSSCPRLKMYIS